MFRFGNVVRGLNIRLAIARASTVNAVAPYMANESLVVASGSFDAPRFLT